MEGFRFHGELPKPQNPYQHELPCSPNCPACGWFRMRHLVMREELQYPPAPIVLTQLDRILLGCAKISWEGDNRGA
jgi:hypothetical protein